MCELALANDASTSINFEEVALPEVIHQVTTLEVVSLVNQVTSATHSGIIELALQLNSQVYNCDTSKYFG